MEIHYTDEKNTLILISLLKSHNIKRIIVSPGSTNIRFAMSVQNDKFFEVYSAPDERSAAYMACGLAAETNEPVVISCTGATASRNYVPGLTEAFYRKLPVLAVTSTQHIGRVGHHVAQVIDRSVQMKDLVKLSIDVPTIHDLDDEWSCVTNVNKAILELTKDGGGPVHINLATTYSMDFTTKELPKYRVINRYTYGDTLPEMPKGRIGIFVGSHSVWNKELIDTVEKFCKKYNSVVFVDQTSGYKGKYHAMVSLLCAQKKYRPDCVHLDLMINIGEITGSYHSLSTKEVWRISPDGEVKDSYKCLTKVFEMNEEDFFKTYLLKEYNSSIKKSFIDEWNKETENIYNKIPENLPFSNPWVAKVTAPKIPKDAVVHLGILSSLRSWNFFETDPTVHCYSNVGGFGIDGGLSSLIGASLANKNKLYFGVFGDLAFFYDMNVLGNRHVGNNVRIILINNGKGTEFRNYNHLGAGFGDDADVLIAAGGHYGNKSNKLVKHYAEDLGYEYYAASTKEEYMAVLDKIINPKLSDKSIIVEVFTNNVDESNSLKVIDNLETDSRGAIKQAAKKVLGQKGIAAAKKIKNSLRK
ncbi:MAG: 2-succinyl-5-enolpyruvyl-6-hydroxy-3-cyclohexene-1-carboxylate synthase [Bacilli bacterium]|nr:2-succinyl-5-enolpyruvyl-6-hydroxy-3-cyclohexene-1-carboxylate synthase [Bacilli bacterium]